VKSISTFLAMYWPANRYGICFAKPLHLDRCSPASLPVRAEQLGNSWYFYNACVVFLSPAGARAMMHLLSKVKMPSFRQRRKA
jgi:hypothetical protein